MLGAMLRCHPAPTSCRLLAMLDAAPRPRLLRPVTTTTSSPLSVILNRAAPRYSPRSPHTSFPPASMPPACMSTASPGPSQDTSATTTPQTLGHEPMRLSVTTRDVHAAKGKLRLDAFLSARLPDLSRTKAQAAVNQGWVLLNGAVTTKAGATARAGDTVLVRALPDPPPLQAVPEAIPLDIVFEDKHLMVINKASGMVVHISAGHHSGTLVNALLHHCGLPGLALEQLPASSQQQQQQQEADQGVEELPSGPDPEEDGDEEVLGLEAALQLLPSSQLPGQPGVLRPGIVHRLDKGTSGLLVVAKQEGAHRALAAQFKDRTVGREYVAVCLGCPQQQQGRVETNIDRDPNDRKRMAALAYGAARGRQAASNYAVLEVLAGGGACLTRWKLDTGRTHQIRVHAKHLGHSLLGDDTYGGSAASSASILAKGRPSKQQAVRELVERLGRPALHARTLSFTHPATGERLSFEAAPPADFQEVLLAVRGL